MSQNNRQRRAANQRARQHRARDRRREPADLGSATFLLVSWVRELSAQAPARGREAFCALPLVDQRTAVHVEFEVAVAGLIDCGWTPLDLGEIARRRASAPAAAYLLAVTARQTAEHPAARVHPRWRAQLDQFSATPAPRLEQWRPDTPWTELIDPLVELLAVLHTLPAVHPVLPAPGTAGAASFAAHGIDGEDGIDAKVLRRVRALLAKAESSEFDEEAEALTAKAQSLMTQYSIDRALAQSTGEPMAGPVARRLWLDAPYPMPKAMLVSQVASANRCRSVIAEALGFITVLGFDTDLDVVELLATSLLVQSSRAMRASGSQVDRRGTARTRSFRQSFLIAYGRRIGERLRDSAERTQAASDTHHHGALLPVLAGRDRAVDDAFTTAFPQLYERGVRVSNAAGWAAGRAAADLASLDVRQSVGSRSA